MKTKLITCILCIACLMPVSFGESTTPIVYYDSTTSSYGLKDVNGDTIQMNMYDGIAEFNNGLAIVQKDGQFGVITTEGVELVPPMYKYITNYKNGYAIVHQDDHAGALNTSGKLVVPIEYSSISHFVNGNALAFKNRKLGIISSKNKVIHPFVWDEAKMLDFNKDFRTFVFKQGNTYGVASLNGAILMDPQDKELFHISDSQVAFVSNNKIGVMTHDEKILVPPAYDSIYVAGDGYIGRSEDLYYFFNLEKGLISQPYDEVKELSDHRYLIIKGNYKGIYDTSAGEVVLEAVYDDIKLLENPHDTSKQYFELTRLSTIKKGLAYKGVANLDGDILIPALYVKLGFINEETLAYYDPQKVVGIYNFVTHEDSGLAYKSIRFDTTGTFGVVTARSGQYGLISGSGKVLIPASTDYIYESGNFYITEKNDKKALYSKEKNRLTAYKFDSIFSFQNLGSTEAAIISVSNLWGLLKPDGTYLVPPEYDAINEFVNGFAIITKDGQYGFINTKGELVVEPQFEDVSSFNEGLAIAKHNGFYGFIHPNGRFVIPAKFDHVKPFNEAGHAVVTLDDRKGIIQKNGQYFLKPIYKSLSFIGDDSIVVQDSATKKYGVLKPTGEVISNMIYDDFGSFFKAKTTFVEINGKYALINTKGEVLTQFIFDDITLFNKGFANIIIGEKRGFINTKGDYILEE